MYRIAKYHMKKDITKVLNWQMNYNKSLKDLNGVLFELDHYEKELNKYKKGRIKIFDNKKILNSINETNIPDLRIELYIKLNGRITSNSPLILSSVKEAMEYIDNENYSDPFIRYIPDEKMLVIYLNDLCGAKLLKNKKIKILKSMNMKTLLNYQTLTNTTISTILNSGYFDNELINSIENTLNRMRKINEKPYTKKIDDIKTISKIDFDKFKDDKFKFTICYHNMPGKKPCCGESVELLKKEIKNINFNEYKYSCGLYKNIISDTISRELYIHLYHHSEYKVININNLPINKEFENFVWSHGLDAYNDDDVFENAKFIVNNPSINISCSFYGDEVGDIGLYVQGDCRFASPYDVASWADRTEGSRFVYKYNCNDLLSKPEDIIEKHYIEDDDNHINTEGIINNIKVVGIWCGNYWSKCDELLNELKKLTGIKEINYI